MIELGLIERRCGGRRTSGIALLDNVENEIENNASSTNGDDVEAKTEDKQEEEEEEKSNEFDTDKSKKSRKESKKRNERYIIMTIFGKKIIDFNAFFFFRPLDRRSSLILTGHSMGGAVASLLAVLLVDEARWASPIDVHTFGAPAVGGSDIAQVIIIIIFQKKKTVFSFNSNNF